MRSARLLTCAALLIAAGCIVERDAIREDELAQGTTELSQSDGEAARALQAQRAARARREARAQRALEAQRRRAAAVQEIPSTEAAEPRPLISNVEPKAEPGPSGDGAALIAPSVPDPSEQPDDASDTGAPGARLSPDALALAWPGAVPVDPSTIPARPAEPAALPYRAPEQPGLDPAPTTEGATGASADDELSTPGVERDPDSFQQPLASYGRWINTPENGRVWIPEVSDEWAPYSDGTWSYTDYGWTFVSLEPFAWAVWHYGTWGFRPRIGWYWVPGRVWGPAWVSWRWGAGYACWRPLSPYAWQGGWRGAGWVGVSAAHFTEPVHAVALTHRALTTAVNSSRPLAGPVAHPAAGRAYGPPARAVSLATGHAVTPRPAAQVLRESTRAARDAAARAGPAHPDFRIPAQESRAPPPSVRSGSEASGRSGAARGDGQAASSSPQRGSHMRSPGRSNRSGGTGHSRTRRGHGTRGGSSRGSGRSGAEKPH